MVFVLKEPTATSKGILMFTHKERPYIRPSVPHVAQRLEKLKKTYLFGMHFGWTVKNEPTTPFIDFYLGGKGVLEKAPDNPIPHIPLGSRNFTPKCFAPNPKQPKNWDILSISTLGKFKNIPQLFQALRHVYDQRPQTRTLLIFSSPDTINPATHYTTINEDFANLFSAKERENITFIHQRQTHSLSPLSSKDIARFMQQSRLFTLFTDTEGGPKVLTESLCTGIPVVVKKHLGGAGRDYLDESNSKSFTTPPEAAECFFDIIENGLGFDPTPIAKEVREDYTVPKLEQELKDLFNQKGEPWEGEIVKDTLNKRLPAHLVTLPRDLCTPLSDDLKSPSAVLEYTHIYLGMEKPTALQKLTADAHALPGKALYRCKVIYRRFFPRKG